MPFWDAQDGIHGHPLPLEPMRQVIRSHGPRALSSSHSATATRATGKSVRARYVATRGHIAKRQERWEITGPA